MYATVGRILYAMWGAAMSNIEEKCTIHAGGPYLLVTGSNT